MSIAQEIKWPEDDYYGKLYDYYSLRIIVSGENDRISIGDKAKKYEEIVWGTAN
ncbi:hypothetical protein [Oceanobacillus manasiensis]|uniref:hypothetical protein n=1 Tax=Oceanobacillus manasiensis TaxID=586413 RepID=UPI000AB13F2F|nr:hypothetical protein [Oceanobacillus manasiensis]